MPDGHARIIDKLLARYRRDGVLLHQPYPPHTAGHMNSKFGGMPRLPEHHDWPRMPNGVPLHFFAQIDCADIPLKSALPSRGVLFFFGRGDEEQVWRADRPEDACRVLYLQDVFPLTPLRAPPDDLPPIGGLNPPPFARRFLRAGEAGPALYTEWPIQPLVFDSWPDSSSVYNEIPISFDWTRLSPARLFKPSLPAWLERQGDVDEIAEAYDEVLAGKRADEYYRVTGAPLPVPGKEWSGYSTSVGLGLFGDDGAPDAFPHHWSHIDFFCRAAVVYIAAGRPGFDDPSTISAIAADWIERAADRQPTECVADAERAAFRDWIAGLPTHPTALPLNHLAASFIIEASLATVRAFAGDPEKARLISPAAYEIMAPLFHGHSTWGPQFSQMLGHAPSAQEARSVKDPTVCLLSLTSDAAVGWMFGDVGECSFWIAPDHLARRDFSRVWGTIEGH
jgi:hypothetical protein